MTYEGFVGDFRRRMFEALSSIDTGLRTSGVSNIVMSELDATNLKFQLVARRGSRTLVVYFELTPVSIVSGEMAVIITLFVEGNGLQIAHSYVAGPPLRYLSDMDALLLRVLAAEQTTDETLTKARTFLQV